MLSFEGGRVSVLLPDMKCDPDVPMIFPLCVGHQATQVLRLARSGVGGDTGLVKTTAIHASVDVALS